MDSNYSKNDHSISNPPAHPFHIHVNPFEIFSILDPAGNEQLDLDDDKKPIPVWRDTIIMPQDYKTLFRTHYEVFDGLFVQHCHILDHEDQGMMELVEIVKPPIPSDNNRSPKSMVEVFTEAPHWRLPDANGIIHCWDCDFKHHLTVLFFFEGTSCLQCRQQITEFSKLAQSFIEIGAIVIGISSSTIEELNTGLRALDFPFPMFADPKGKVFSDYACYCGGPLHGTFIIDESKNIRWQTVSTTPYFDIKDVLIKTKSLILGKK